MFRVLFGPLLLTLWGPLDAARGCGMAALVASQARGGHCERVHLQRGQVHLQPHGVAASGCSTKRDSSHRGRATGPCQGTACGPQSSTHSTLWAGQRSEATDQHSCPSVGKAGQRNEAHRLAFRTYTHT